MLRRAGNYREFVRDEALWCYAETDSGFQLFGKGGPKLNKTILGRSRLKKWKFLKALLPDSGEKRARRKIFELRYRLEKACRSRVPAERENYGSEKGLTSVFDRLRYRSVRFMLIICLGYQYLYCL